MHKGESGPSDNQPSQYFMIWIIQIYGVFNGFLTITDGFWSSDLGSPFWQRQHLPPKQMLREIRHITSYPTNGQIIDQFNAYVRGPLRDNVVKCLGKDRKISTSWAASGLQNGRGKGYLAPI